MRRERGEVLTIVAITVAATLLLSASIPSINIFGKVFGGGSSMKAPQEEAWKEQTKITEPVTIGVTATGEKVVAFRERQEFRSGASKSAAKLTYGERIGGFFAGLTIWGIIAVIFCFFVLGITPSMIIMRLKGRAQKAFENEKTEKEKLKQALTNTVAALQGVDDDTWKLKLKPLLEGSQDKQDRDIIKDIKKELDK